MSNSPAQKLSTTVTNKTFQYTMKRLILNEYTTQCLCPGCDEGLSVNTSLSVFLLLFTVQAAAVK